jgi:hypothetical protein
VLVSPIPHEDLGGDLPEPVTRPCEIENLAQAA